VEKNGSTGTKSTVPAIVVLRLAFGNRLMRRMPEVPAASLAQLSSLPAPSEVMIPIPVTTTVGFPLLSRIALSLSRRFNEPHAFTAPVADGSDGDLMERTFIWLFDPGRVERREQLFATEHERRNGDVHHELRFHAVADRGAGCAHREVGKRLEPGTLFACCRLRAGRARDDCSTAGCRTVGCNVRPHPRQGVSDRSGGP